MEPLICILETGKFPLYTRELRGIIFTRFYEKRTNLAGFLNPKTERSRKTYYIFLTLPEYKVKLIPKESSNFEFFIQKAKNKKALYIGELNQVITCLRKA